MRKPFIAGNWKMFLNKESGRILAKTLAEETRDINDRNILVCPSFPFLSDIADALKGSNIKLGAQNMYYEKEGAFTGEVSADMLLSVACEYVILGHSERRHVFGESDELINKKLLAAIENNLKPILCVGELLEEREEARTEDVINRQIKNGLKNVLDSEMDSVIVAYEPVWAIGTGKTATPEDANTVHEFIRSTISDSYNRDVADNLIVLYGGSVKPKNVDDLMAKDNIDGALVGGASLKADSFLRIIRFEN